MNIVQPFFCFFPFTPLIVKRDIQPFFSFYSPYWKKVSLLHPLGQKLKLICRGCHFLAQIGCSRVLPVLNNDAITEGFASLLKEDGVQFWFVSSRKQLMACYSMEWGKKSGHEPGVWVGWGGGKGE